MCLVQATPPLMSSVLLNLKVACVSSKQLLLLCLVYFLTLKLHVSRPSKLVVKTFFDQFVFRTRALDVKCDMQLGENYS